MRDETALRAMFAALKDFAPLPPLQLTAHEVALERCRLAVEWQAAISEAAVLLFERTDALLAHVNAAAEIARQGNNHGSSGGASDWSRVQQDASALLQTTATYHQVNGKLRGCLLQLGGQIHTMEDLSCQLAALADQLEQSKQRIAAQLG